MIDHAQMHTVIFSQIFTDYIFLKWSGSSFLKSVKWYFVELDSLLFNHLVHDCKNLRESATDTKSCSAIPIRGSTFGNTFSAGIAGTNQGRIRFRFTRALNKQNKLISKIYKVEKVNVHDKDF